jgi:hypothetical protein
LVAGSALTKQDRFRISTLIALLYLRTPTSRRTAAELMAARIGALYTRAASDERKIDDFLHKRDDTGSKPKFIDREQFQQSISAENVSISISKHVGIAMMSIFPKIGELIFGMQWGLLEASVGNYFITSDNPVVLDALAPSEVIGFALPQAVVSLPLSPTICSGAPVRQLGDPEAVDDFNRLRVARAERFVFADRQDANIAELVRQYPDRPEIIERIGHAKPFSFAEVKVPRRWKPP